MSSKAPIYLKRGSRKGKKEKLRDVLSSDMISPPLGDFRHTIHIGSSGRENDLFGDLSFLQGKFHLLPGRQGPGISRRSARPASICAPPLSTESSPLLKNAFSLPVMRGAQALSLPPPSQAPPPKPPRLHLDDPARSSDGYSPCTTPTSSTTPNGEDRPCLSHAGSLLSLHLDLGPSILDDVLQIMDRHDMGGLSGRCLHGGRCEIFT